MILRLKIIYSFKVPSLPESSGASLRTDSPPEGILVCTSPSHGSSCMQVSRGKIGGEVKE